MKTIKNHDNYYTPIQMKIPEDLEKIIEISDPIYTFNEIMNQIDLYKYFAGKESKTGRPRFDCVKLLKIILFAFMENSYASLRNIEKLCKTDIRFIWMLDGSKAPSYSTVSNFMNEMLIERVEDVFNDINSYIFAKENVDLNHMYIDGTKLEANANKYTWVWKKACRTSREKIYLYLTQPIQKINDTDLFFCNSKIGIRKEYTIEYVEYILEQYQTILGIDVASFVRGSGKRKSLEQKHYEKLEEYLKKLKKYAHHIKMCGDDRNSYSKTDNDATFMRIKRDYMGNDQLLPAYNIQLGICDEFIAVTDIKQFASDMECFVPLMEKFNNTYGFYPRYPVADAGYGNYNNYLYCEQRGMEKYMKFTMFKKETTDKKYREDPFRAVNFQRDTDGNLICPNGRKFEYLYDRAVKGNKYGRTEEFYQCEDCSNCPFAEKCKKGEGNRTVRMNEELTAIHKEVLENLTSTHGLLLRANRSIQAEGTYGVINGTDSTEGYEDGA